MRGLMTILTVMHMNYLKSEHNVSSIDEYLGKPYVFNMFENFEECSRLYKSEKNVLSKLMEVRSTLLQLQKDLLHEVWNLQTKSMYRMMHVSQLVFISF